jgi:uncharacterized membrane protein
VALAKQDAALVLANSVQAVTLFGLLSKADLSEIRSMAVTKAARDDIRASLWLAACLAVALGVATAVLIGSTAPVYIHLILAGGMLLLFEYNLSQVPSRPEREGRAKDESE